MMPPPPRWQIWRRRQSIWHAHMPCHQVRRRLGAGRFHAYAKITCVRDPFRRVVSMYHWRQRDVLTDDHEFGFIRQQFRDFILSGNWPDDRDIVLLEGKFIMDHAIWSEHLPDDLTELNRKLDLGLDISELTHTKKVARPHKARRVEEYFDEETIDVVRRRMAWVFENFDYPDRPT